MKVFALTDGPTIRSTGIAAQKKSPTLYYIQQTEPFTVPTSNGAVATGEIGDYVGYDPVTGNMFVAKQAFYAANIVPVSA